MDDYLTLAPLQFYCNQQLPAGVRHLHLSRLEPIVGDNLVYMMTAAVYGKEGTRAQHTFTVRVWRGPRWLTRWLSKRKLVTLDMTPYLVFPDMTYKSPELGDGVRVVLHHPTWEDDDG